MLTEITIGIGMDKADRTLTLSEKNFLFELTRTDSLRPKSNVEAYCRIYKTNQSRKTDIHECSRALGRPHMVKALADIESKIEQDRRRASRGNMQAIQTALWEEARDADKAADRISALRTLASLLPKNAIDESTLSSASSKSALIDRLNTILSSVDDTIDVSPEIQAESVDEKEILEIEAELLSSDEPDY